MDLVMWGCKKKLITACTLVYNKLDFCQRAIETTRKNKGIDGEHFEYVLWDNGAPYPGVKEYLQKYRDEPDYTHVMGDGVNIGVGAALNRVLEYTDSEFFLKVDDDCAMLPMTIPLLVLAYTAAQQAGFPIGVLSADVLGVGKAEGPYFEVEVMPGMILESTWCVGGGCVLISRKVLENVGPWRDDRLYGIEDGDFAHRATEKGYRNAYLKDAYHISYCRGDEADPVIDKWKLEYYAGMTDLPFDEWRDK